MTLAFLSEAGRSPAFNLSIAISADPPEGRESVRLLVIGSRAGVINVIHTLHHHGFAEVGAWSPLLPGPNPGEVMSILTWYISPGLG